MARVIFTVLAILALLALVHGTPFTAKFNLTGTILNYGRMSGTMEYDSSAASLSLKFASNSYKMQYSFNSDGSYNGQFLYETGASSICGKCQRIILDADMPRFTDPPGGSWTAGGSETINGRSCKTFTYSGSNRNPEQPKKIALAATDDPCMLTYFGGRVLTFQPRTPASSLDFSVPSDCRCHKRLDLILSLDSSNSIDDTEWGQIGTFVNRLVKSFTFGPDAAAMDAVGYWQEAKVIVPPLDDGVKLNALTQNLPRPSRAGGTNVLAAFAVHDAQTIPLLRTGATPVFITVTDGADQSSPAQITTKINTYKARGIVNFISVFVGKPDATTPDQMLALAGQDKSRVFVYSDFTAFSTAADQIQTAACTSNVANGGCGRGCCGMCMCGTCVSPTSCDDGRKCTTESLRDTTTNGLQCCESPNPLVCTPPNLCQLSSCEEATGQCNTKPKVCPPKDPMSACLNESKCDDAIGCQTIDKCKPENCNDNNACTLDVMNNATATCSHTLIPCEPIDKCHTAACDDINGCVQTPINVTMCDDFNVCTEDSCDPAIGCVHLVKTACNDNMPCTVDRCDALKGCVSDLKVCPGKPKCDIGVCVNGTCSFQRPLLCKDEVLAVGLSTSAVVGIVIALIVAAALGAFGVFKGVQAYNASQDLDDAGQNNPLYEMGGQYGESGIYVAAK